MAAGGVLGPELRAGRGVAVVLDLLRVLQPRRAHVRGDVDRCWLSITALGLGKSRGASISRIISGYMSTPTHAKAILLTTEANSRHITSPPDLA